MSLRYTKISKSPTIFNRLFGISVSQFEEIYQKLEPRWEKSILKAYKRPGRHYKLELRDMLLLLLLYYRSYITQAFIGYLFGIDDSRVCRIIQKLEPLLKKEFSIKPLKCLSKEEVETLIFDATEHPIERPTVDQEKYYSGKKKRHTLKSEIGVTGEGKIVSISPSHPGSKHDFNIRKSAKEPIPKESRVYVDSGYLGIDKLHEDVEFPYKRRKNNPLTDEEKEYNHALSRVRVVVENIIGDFKTFKIASDKYRNKLKRHEVKMEIIAGIVNMKNGFLAA